MPLVPLAWPDKVHVHPLAGVWVMTEFDAEHLREMEHRPVVNIADERIVVAELVSDFVVKPGR